MIGRLLLFREYIEASSLYREYTYLLFSIVSVERLLSYRENRDTLFSIERIERIGLVLNNSERTFSSKQNIERLLLFR